MVARFWGNSDVVTENRTNWILSIWLWTIVHWVIITYNILAWLDKKHFLPTAGHWWHATATKILIVLSVLLTVYHALYIHLYWGFMVILYGYLRPKNFEQTVLNPRHSAEYYVASSTNKVHRVLIYPKLSFAQHFSLLVQNFYLVKFWICYSSISSHPIPWHRSDGESLWKAFGISCIKQLSNNIVISSLPIGGSVVI